MLTAGHGVFKRNRQSGAGPARSRISASADGLGSAEGVNGSLALVSLSLCGRVGSTGNLRAQNSNVYEGADLTEDVTWTT